MKCTVLAALRLELLRHDGDAGPSRAVRNPRGPKGSNLPVLAPFFLLLFALWLFCSLLLFACVCFLVFFVLVSCAALVHVFCYITRGFGRL